MRAMPRRNGPDALLTPSAPLLPGTFADTDLDVVASYPDGIGHERVTGDKGVSRMLQDAGLDKQTAERDAQALHEGAVLVLADIGNLDPIAVTAVLDAP